MRTMTIVKQENEAEIEQDQQISVKCEAEVVKVEMS